jgi:hypothetical protein
MTFEIPYITRAWRWLGQELQAESVATQQQQRELDVAARQSDSFLGTAGLKTLAMLHGVGAWMLKTPSTLAYGSVDFVATLLTDTPAALRAIPEAIQHNGNEAWAGGALILKGNFSEGISRVLDGITGDTMIVLGARGAMRGVVKAAPEATRLTTLGYQTYADAMNAAPGTALDIWMRHPRRGAVMLSIPDPVFARTRSLIGQATEAQTVDATAVQGLFRMIADHPEQLTPHLPELIGAAKTSRQLTLVVNELQQTAPQAFTSAHITAILEAAPGQFMLRGAIQGLLETRIAQFNASHVPLFRILAPQDRVATALYQELQCRRPDLF